LQAYRRSIHWGSLSKLSRLLGLGQVKQVHNLFGVSSVLTQEV
jgi:hypothetical protein